MEPRGLRNNNPLNIRRNNTCWKGMKKEQTDAAFVEFESLAYGYRAAWRVLYTYFYRFVTQKKAFTVANIIGRWAPPNENDTQSYIHSVLSLTSIGGKEKLLPPTSVEGYPKLAKLLSAMTVMENGIRMDEVDTQAILEGYKLAFPDRRGELEAFLLQADEYHQW